MTLVAICRWIQDTPSSTLLRESTWGFTILGSLHVLGIAWFGGTVLFPGMRTWKRIGLAWMLLTGGLLFWLEPLKCYFSVSFRVKMLPVVIPGRAPSAQTGLCLVAYSVGRRDSGIARHRVLFSNSRKTECGAGELLIRLSVRAAPFALLIATGP
jgi:hypothetical protein